MKLKAILYLGVYLSLCQYFPHLLSDVDENQCREGPTYGHKWNLRVKVKFTLEQAMKAQRGSRGIALLFL
jgi:hypothetical protein